MLSLFIYLLAINQVITSVTCYDKNSFSMETCNYDLKYNGLIALEEGRYIDAQRNLFVFHTCNATDREVALQLAYAYFFLGKYSLTLQLVRYQRDENEMALFERTITALSRTEGEGNIFDSLTDSGVSVLNEHMRNLDNLVFFTESLSTLYAKKTPFPYVDIHDLFDHTIINRAIEEFPIFSFKNGSVTSTEDMRIKGWYPTYFNVQNKKVQCNNEHFFGPTQIRLMHFFKSSMFIAFLETLTGIRGLVFDPHYFGGGLHQTLSGGHLSLHADFNWHKTLHLWRRVNVFLYLNADWQEDWGGHLELWDSQLGAVRERVSPRANTMVVFTSSDSSFHGHPDPLRSPSEVSRKSIALYYYTADAGPYATSARSTGDGRREGTDFRSRPGEGLDDKFISLQ